MVDVDRLETNLGSNRISTVCVYITGHWKRHVRFIILHTVPYAEENGKPNPTKLLPCYFVQHVIYASCCSSMSSLFVSVYSMRKLCMRP